MTVFIIITVLAIAISPLLAALVGVWIRYGFLFLGFYLPFNFDISHYGVWLGVIISNVLALIYFRIFEKGKNMHIGGPENTKVAYHTTVCLSAFFVGTVIGLIAGVIRYFFF